MCKVTANDSCQTVRKVRKLKTEIKFDLSIKDMSNNGYVTLL